MYQDYSWERTLAPKEQALTVAEVKSWLRIDPDLTDEDRLIEAMIASVSLYTEKFSGLALTSQKWTLNLHCFPCVIELKKRPAIAVDAIKYVDPDGTLQTLAAFNYQSDLAAFLPKICPAYGYYWPSARYQYKAVRVEMTMGYGAAAQVPGHVKTAMCLAIGHFWENRENTVTRDFELLEMPMGYKHLLASEAIVNV